MSILRKKHALLAVGAGTIVVLAFQNCSQVNFKGSSAAPASSQAQITGVMTAQDTTDTLVTNEDQAIKGQVQSAATTSGQPSKFSALTSPSSGTISNFDPTTGSFTYTPNSHFFGADHFQLTELNPVIGKSIARSVVVNVGRLGQPTILTDVLNFDINTSNNPFTVQILDAEISNAWSDISADGSVMSIMTKNGAITKTPTGFTYTPSKDFRGSDQATLFALDSKGGASQRLIRFIVGNPLKSMQPGMAVRAANCIQCHAQINSNFVTDFGYGNDFFFARDKTNPTSGDYVYSLRMASDQGSNQYFPDWITSSAFGNGAQLIVPKANMGFKYADFAPSWVDTSAPWLQATTIADLMTKIQALPNSSFKATVVEKDKVYIGVPSIADLKAAGQLDATHPVQYWKDSDLSYDLSGVTLATGGYYTNTGVINCDGDLFIDGTVFLNQVSIKTISGCRLHATGPIFMQKALTYVTDPALQANANLQLVSARSISMGIGDSHCEAQTDTNGWYFKNNNSSPLNERYNALAGAKDVHTRNTDSTSGFPQTAASPAAEATYIVAEGRKIVGLEDASCHGRAVSFERILLVAPQIHSRYKGNFSGVAIAEFPMFSLQSFVYQFDPVFLKVPVLPLMDMSKILVIQ